MRKATVVLSEDRMKNLVLMLQELRSVYARRGQFRREDEVAEMNAYLKDVEFTEAPHA